MIVKTRYGRIEGVEKGRYAAFFGVPYARPPVGELRWREPQPLEGWDGVYDATYFRSKCVQEVMDDPLYTKEFYSNPEFERSMSEDCLYINIWAPVNVNEACPVAFWIHGGAFMGGFSSELEFDGAELCKRGVILVSVEYRCNVFGFFAHPWLSEENKDHRSGNYGILDQIAALKWTYKNIHSFGGDPNNITVFGQSAGAMSVQALVSSELTRKMISKAIMQSGGSFKYGLHQDLTLKELEGYGVILSDILKVNSLEELRAKSANEIQDHVREFIGAGIQKYGNLFLIPVIDHYVLNNGYYNIMDQGKLHDIPYLIGSNKDDIMADNASGDQKEEHPLYKGCKEFSFKLEELGRKPAYVYHFTRRLPGDGAGAFHSAELWYMFGTLNRCWRPMEEHDYGLSRKMLDYWTNFMKNGDPNGNGLDKWEYCSKENPEVMIFD